MSWKPEQYTVDTLNGDILNGKITVPKFQRGKRWSKKQKAMLIDSMINGFPFGSILLYQNGVKRQIIDGLQRSTTVIEFVKNPANYFSEDYLDNASLRKIVHKLGTVSDENVQIEKVKKIIKDWIVLDHHSMRDINRMQYNELVTKIIEEFPTAENNKSDIKDIVKVPLTKFQDICADISNVVIPALIYEGEESKLPEIFERINSQGSKLTKQEIYAASWADDLIKIDDSKLSEIITNNRDRYDNILDESMELDDYNPTTLLREKQVNVFELVFGFGKMISRKYPHLFDFDPENKTKIESVGFNLINACLCQKNNEMSKLNVRLKELIGFKSRKIQNFLGKILESIEFVDKRLSTATKFKSNTRDNSKVYTLHTEMQIVSIIASVFIMRHVDFEFDDNAEIINVSINCDQYKSKWSANREKFRKNVIKVYTIDNLSQKWKGTGDKKLDDIIFDSNYYTREISWNEFEQNLDLYFNNLNNERNERTKIAAPKETEKLLINLIYSKIFTAAEQINDNKYDIEHLATKNIMKEKICSYGDDFRLPISSIGNICLLPEYENRMKKDKTIYQDEEYINKVSDLNYLEEKFTFTKKEDFKWLEEKLSEEEFKSAYYTFINNRFNKIKEKLKENLF